MFLAVACGTLMPNACVAQWVQSTVNGLTARSAPQLVVTSDGIRVYAVSQRNTLQYITLGQSTGSAPTDLGMYPGSGGPSCIVNEPFDGAHVRCYAVDRNRVVMGGGSPKNGLPWIWKNVTTERSTSLPTSSYHVGFLDHVRADGLDYVVTAEHDLYFLNVRHVLTSVRLGSRDSIISSKAIGPKYVTASCTLADDINTACFGRARDGRLAYASLRDSAHITWHSVSMVIPSPPSLLIVSDGGTHVFAVTSDGHLLHTAWKNETVASGTVQPIAWSILADRVRSTPSCVTGSIFSGNSFPRRMTCAVLQNDGAIRLLTYQDTVPYVSDMINNCGGKPCAHFHPHPKPSRSFETKCPFTPVQVCRNYDLVEGRKHYTSGWYVCGACFGFDF